ncbi:MAG: hypothetical protein ACE5OR_07985 [bacterium]
MAKVNLKVDIEELKEALMSLSETEFERLIQEARKSKLHTKLKTITMEKLVARHLSFSSTRAKRKLVSRIISLIISLRIFDGISSNRHNSIQSF